MNTNEIMNEI